MDIAFEEFLEECKKFYCNYDDEPFWNRHSRNGKIEPFLYIKWSTGGYSGGNCWGGEAEGYTSTEEEPDFDCLDNILANYCPNISYLKYKKLAELIECEYYTNHEYYGNSTDYCVKKIEIRKLYDFLCNVS